MKILRISLFISFLSIKVKAILFEIYFLFIFFSVLFFSETGEGAGLRSPAYRIREAAECRSLVCFGAHLLPDATPPEIVVKGSSPSTYITVFCIIQVLAVLSK